MTKTGKNISLALLPAALLAAIFCIGISCDSTSGPDAEPEVLSVGPSRATIAWRSQRDLTGEVFYHPAKIEEKTLSAREAIGPGRLHEVEIKGLRPATRYAYRLHPKGPSYEFRTQPLATTPFSFLMIWGDPTGRVLPLVMSEFPEFVLSPTPVSLADKDPFAPVRPYLPIFDPRGANSPYLSALDGDGLTEKKRTAWKLDWGGLRLIFPGGEMNWTSLFNAPAAHTIGVMLDAQRAESLLANDGLSTSSIQNSEIHSILRKHNERFPSRPAAFAILPAAAGGSLELDGITYLALNVGEGEKTPGGAARIDVGVESTRLTFLGDTAASREIVLRSPPLKQARSCAECRRLADQGAYEESLKAYQEFIKNNEGHFQIDDAYYAIAEIYDEKLFRFPEALEWYRRLVREYPETTLSPMARLRIDFLSAHSDHDFIPLARFERIRRVEFARGQNDAGRRAQILAEVAAILKEFPKSTMAPTMHYWLANQYRLSDPDRAVALYKTLLENFPDESESQDAWLEIGETLYDAERYEESYHAYQEALAAIPERADAIQKQMQRSQRNIRRIQLMTLSWAILALIVAGGTLWPPFGISMSRARRSVLVMAVLGVLFLCGGWLIQEQFNSVGDLFALSLGLAAAASLGLPFTAGLAEKCFQAKRPGSRNRLKIFRATCALLLGLIFFMFGTFAILYLVNPHFLIVVGL